MRIRTKSGEVIDLEQVRRSFEAPFRRVLGEYDRPAPDYAPALLVALQAALNVPEVKRIAVENEWDKGFEQGFDNARKIIRQAAGVIEEPADG